MAIEVGFDAFSAALAAALVVVQPRLWLPVAKELVGTMIRARPAG